MRKDTALVYAGRDHESAVAAVNPAVERASTYLFSSMEEYEASAANKFTDLRYGRYGTRTTYALQDALTALEGGYRCVILPSGLAAIAVSLLAFTRPGGHILVADNVYGPTRVFCDTRLRAAGVEVQYFAPGIGADIASLTTSRTTAIYCESPGSATFEVEDLPALASVAAANGIPLLHDNTWATPYFFDSFKKGVDVSIHAATKYISGHSDIMLGVVVCNERTWKAVRTAAADFGLAASPDDCYLALRGLRTLAVRLERHEKSALAVASWLEARPEVKQVFYPALPSHTGHAIWKRDFSGASGLFSFVLNSTDRVAARALATSLRYFGIGSSWGGYESLITLPQPTRTVSPLDKNDVLVRLHIGLEAPDDLIKDLDHGFSHLHAERVVETS